MEKTHKITSATPLIDETNKRYGCKVRAKKKADEKYGQGRTYSTAEMKSKFNIETPENCKNLIGRECSVVYDLEF